MGKRPKTLIKKEGLLKKNLFNIINSSGVILAIIISLYSYNQNEEIAEKSGAFDKGKLNVFFGDYALTPYCNYDLYYGVDIKKNDLNFAKLPIEIINSGNKTIEDVSLYYQYPTRTISLSDSLIKMETMFIDEIERKYQRDYKHDNISYNIGKLNPYFFIGSGDIIYINGETKGKYKTLVKTKDNKEIILTTEAYFSYPFSVAITGKDIETTNYTFNLKIRKENNLEELIQQIVEERLQEFRKGRKGNTSFFVTVPTISKKYESIKILESNPSKTFLVQFDEDFKHVLIINTDGSIKNISTIN